MNQKQNRHQREMSNQFTLSIADVVTTKMRRKTSIFALATLSLFFAASVSAQSSDKQQKYDAAVAACKLVKYPGYCNFINLDLSGLDLTAEPRNPSYDYSAGLKPFHVSIYFDGSDLRNANLKGRLLQNAGFRKSDVTGAIFEGTNTSGALFTGAIGVGSPPGSAIINTAVVPPTVAAPMARVVTKGDCDQIKTDANNIYDGRNKQYDTSYKDFRHCPMAGKAYSFANFSNSILPVDLSKTSWTDSNLEQTELRGRNFSGASGAIVFVRTVLPLDLRGVNFNDATLKEVNFAKRDLTGASFANANIAGAQFSGAIGTSTFLGTKPEEGPRGMAMGVPVEWKYQPPLDRYFTANYCPQYAIGADLRQCALSGKTFEGLDLRNVEFPQNMQRVQISNSNLASSKLQDRDLTGATLTNVNLHLAELGSAILEGVISSGITGTPKSLPAGWVLKEGKLLNANLASVKTQLLSEALLRDTSRSIGKEPILSWKTVALNEGMPPAAVIGGSETLGGADMSIAVCRVSGKGTNYQYLVGKAVPSYGPGGWGRPNCHVTDGGVYTAGGGVERVEPIYEVLLINPYVTNLGLNITGWKSGIPRQSLQTQAVDAGVANYLCRVSDAGQQVGQIQELQVGQTVQVTCRYGYGGKVRSSDVYEVYAYDEKEFQQAQNMQNRGADEPFLAPLPVRLSVGWWGQSVQAVNQADLKSVTAQALATGANRINAFEAGFGGNAQRKSFRKVGAGVWQETDSAARTSTLFAEASRTEDELVLVSGPSLAKADPKYGDTPRWDNTVVSLSMRKDISQISATYKWEKLYTMEQYDRCKAASNTPDSWTRNGYGGRYITDLSGCAFSKQPDEEGWFPGTQNLTLRVVSNVPFSLLSSAMSTSETIASVMLEPINQNQKTSYWTKANPPPLLFKKKLGNGTQVFTSIDDQRSYQLLTQSDDWIELFHVAKERSMPEWKGDFDSNPMMRAQFLRIDLQANVAWELTAWLSTRDITGKTPEQIKARAMLSNPDHAWARAYGVSHATDFTPDTVGFAFGRLDAGQPGAGDLVGWSLRTEQSGALQWEEQTVLQAKAGVTEGSPIGPMLTETYRSGDSIGFSGGKWGKVDINLASRAICQNGPCSKGGKRIATLLGGDAEFPGQRKKVPQTPIPGVAPGFMFINKTDWPVKVLINQVGCLYHGIIQPGEYMVRKTGSVWFELEARWALDGVETSWAECAWKPTLAAAGVFMTMATAGSGAPLVAVVGAGVVAAATMGAAETVDSIMKADGASEKDRTIAMVGIYVASAGLEAAPKAVNIVTTKLTTRAVNKALQKSMSAPLLKASERTAMQQAGKFAADELMDGAAKSIDNVATTAAVPVTKQSAQEFVAAMGPKLLQRAKEKSPKWMLTLGGAAANYTLDEMDAVYEAKIVKWFGDGSSKFIAGQYAGHLWPYKMKDRVMPMYEITGGPVRTLIEEGNEIIREGTPMKFTRIN